MYHRMYLRRSSMSSISEESETGDDDEVMEHQEQTNNRLSKSIEVENCLGHLHNFKEEIREAYEELSTLERQARMKNRNSSSTSAMFNIDQEDDLDILLNQLHQLEQQFDDDDDDDEKTFRQGKTSMSSTMIEQFEQLDQTLATLTHTLNNVEIEFLDSGNSSSSSATSDSTRIHDEHFSDSGLSRSTDSLSLPLMSQQISNASSILSCDTLKNPSTDQQKIRLALEKMHEANIKKLFVKIHNDDQSTKNILIDETMSISNILILLFHKYHLQPTLNYSIIEDLPDLHIYRIFEDHQNLINQGLVYWSRNSSNRICFREHRNKYLLFEKPQQFFSNKEKNAENILNDYISSETIFLPDDITSTLFIKEKNRKVWKKSTCILRQSGIYQIPKSSSSKRDLICLLKFDSNIQLYYAQNWTEVFRSPTSFGFALKYAHIQKKSNKYIHYLCANSSEDYQRWINGIRIILFGVDLYRNYKQISQIVRDGLENLVHLLPNQHHFNFITSTTSAMQQSTSTISLPINQIVSETNDSQTSLIDIDSTTPLKYATYSLDRLKTSKTLFTRSSSFHSSLRSGKSDKKEQKLFRTKSTSPPDASPIKTDGIVLKRSKSNKEIHSRSSKSTVSPSSSILPFINQCLQSEKTTPVHVKPPRRPPPPPLPPKISSFINNHIYDSLQDSPILSNKDHRTVINTRLPPTRVTDL